MPNNTTTPILTDRTYDRLRYGVQYVLPGMGTLYSAIAILWGLPYGEQVVGTFAALAVFGGVLLGVSKRSYNNSDAKYDGDLVVTDDNATAIGINGNVSVEEVLAKGEVTLKVVPESSQE